MGVFYVYRMQTVKTCLIFLDDAVRFCLPFIFEGTPFCGFEAYTFKFTKDAEMELDTDLRNSVMQKIAKGVKSRKKGNRSDWYTMPVCRRIC